MTQRWRRSKPLNRRTARRRGPEFNLRLVLSEAMERPVEDDAFTNEANPTNIPDEKGVLSVEVGFTPKGGRRREALGVAARRAAPRPPEPPLIRCAAPDTAVTRSVGLPQSDARRGGLRRRLDNVVGGSMEGNTYSSAGVALNQAGRRRSRAGGMWATTQGASTPTRRPFAGRSHPITPHEPQTPREESAPNRRLCGVVRHHTLGQVGTGKFQHTFGPTCRGGRVAPRWSACDGGSGTTASRSEKEAGGEKDGRGS